MQKQLKQTFFGEYLLYGHISLWRGGGWRILLYSHFFLWEILLWENHIHFSGVGGGYWGEGEPLSDNYHAH